MPDSELFLILGADMARLPWRAPRAGALAGDSRRGRAPRYRPGGRGGGARRRSHGRGERALLRYARDRDLLDDAPPRPVGRPADPSTWCPSRPAYIDRSTGSTGGQGWRPADVTPEELADADAALAADRKALDIVQLDLRGVIGYTDYFVICTGRTERQTKAIHDAIHEGMKSEYGRLPRRVEGLPEARWILMDYLDVVVHVFTPETREYYRLEQLWGEAPATRWLSKRRRVGSLSSPTWRARRRELPRRDSALASDPHRGSGGIRVSRRDDQGETNVCPSADSAHLRPGGAGARESPTGSRASSSRSCT